MLAPKSPRPIWLGCVLLASVGACAGEHDAPSPPDPASGGVAGFPRGGSSAVSSGGTGATSGTTAGAAPGHAGVGGTSPAGGTGGSATGGGAGQAGSAANVGGTAGTMNLGGTAGTAGAASAGGASGQPNGTGGLGSSGAASGAGGDGGTPANAAGRSGAAGQGSSGAGQGGGTSGTGGSASGTFSICSSAPPSGTRVVSVYVIGDSTASIYTSDVYPRTGWAQVVGDAFSASCAVVKDKALSGRSSKSFSDEGAFTPVQSALAAGDFLLIQFGHNDEKSDDPAKYTEPQTTYKQYLTTYVNAARAKQAVPILLTPISRNQWSGATLADTHGAYPAAVRELAASLDVPLVDMTRLTKQHFERIGQAATTVLFMNLTAGEFPNYPSGNSDNTHLRETGARVVAQLFVSDAYSQRLAVASGLAAVPVAP